MDKSDLKREYKNRLLTGGIYVIKNTRLNKLFLDAAADIQNAKNRFEFSKKVGSCVSMKLNKDWSACGGADFEIEVLEEVKMGENQTEEEFKSDLALLKELWAEKLSGREFY